MKNDMPFGATIDDWKLWVRDLKLMDDLLPIVCDPSVEISVYSKMKEVGKTPSHVNPNGYAAGIKEWTKLVPQANDIKHWMKDNRHGICLQTRRVYALDIDVDDPKLAEEIETTIESIVGKLPRRVRNNSPRRVLLFRPQSGKTGAKKLIRLAVDQGIIERLGTGQQVVVCGTHKSGARYDMDWQGHEDIPVLAEDVIENMWIALGTMYGVETIDYKESEDALPFYGNVNDPVVEWMHKSDKVKVFGVSNDGTKVFVECPWKHNHSVESGPTESAWLVAGSNNRENGMYKCMHASCMDKGRVEFLHAIGYVEDGFDNLPVVATEKPDQEVLSAPKKSKEIWIPRNEKTGNIIDNYENLLKGVSYEEVCGYDVYYDTFSDLILVKDDNPSEMDRIVCAPGWRPILDTDFTKIAINLNNYGFKMIGTDKLREFVKLAAKNKEIDSFSIWAEDLQWDGVERVETFLENFAGARPTELNRNISKYLWTGMAARATTIGAKVDAAVLFCGVQGGGKSSLVAAMAPWPGSAGTLSFESSDADNARKGRGKLVRELAELQGLKGKDSETIKAWMTEIADEFVPKYQEFSVRIPRRWVIIGTTNEKEFLKDRTGNRRWLPVEVDITEKMACVKGVQMLNKDHGYVREQLWAEAIEMYHKNGVAYEALLDNKQLEDIRKNAMIEDITDTFIPMIESWIDNLSPEHFITVNDIALYLKDKTGINYNQSLVSYVAQSLHKMGYEKTRKRVIISGKKRQVVIWNKIEEQSSE